MTLHPLKVKCYLPRAEQGGAVSIRLKLPHREGIRPLIPWYLKVYPKTKGRDSHQDALSVPLVREKPGKSKSESFGYTPLHRALSLQKARTLRRVRSGRGPCPQSLRNPPSNPLQPPRQCLSAQLGAYILWGASTKGSRDPTRVARQPLDLERSPCCADGPRIRIASGI
jgi:hypothetical protein